MNGTSPSPQRRWRLATVLLVLVAGVALGEWLGWPFLAAPTQRLLADKLDRRVSFAADAVPGAAPATAFRVRFVGGLRLVAPQLEIGAPAWSSEPHLLLARGIELDMRYIDLWRAYRGQPLRIHRLLAATLDGQLERRADGRASWQFGADPLPGALPTAPTPVPVFGNLQVADGTLRYRDAPQAIDVVARLSLTDAAPLVVAASQPAASSTVPVLQVNATGRYRNQALKITLAGALPLAAEGALSAPVAVTLDAIIGRATLAFKGTAVDALHLSGLTGSFNLAGPSLAAVGDPLGVTLPSTGAFRTHGLLVKQGDTWRVRIDAATVGASRLNGAFTYEANHGGVPLLSGRLSGSRLLLADLGPALGKTPGAATRGKGMVLPDRPFDLAALRAMNANVLIDVSDVDLNTTLLEPLRPLHAHLQLSEGVLTIKDLDARTAQGQLKGDLRLDGRGSQAIWDANLRWADVRLERWIRQTRAEGSPPYVSGRLDGEAKLQGVGRSTAEILASLKGRARTELREGSVSHLLIEAAGLDLAQGLGLLIKGDDALPVQCGVADMLVEGGVFRPRVLVLDTPVTTLWVDGSLSLATEALDLRAVVVPKNFSPLTLRTPLHVSGSFAKPEVSLEKGTLGAKLGGALLLALVNPLAALIPLIDTGDTEQAQQGAAGCQKLARRIGSKTPVKAGPAL